MRTSLFLLTLMGAVTLHAGEPLKVPDFVKFLEDMENLDGVMKEATAQNKGVTFLLMEPGST